MQVFKQSVVDLTSAQTIDGIKTFVQVLRAATPVGTTDLTTKAYVDGGFVDLTSSQTVGGLKTFTSNIVNEHSGSVQLTVKSTDAAGLAYVNLKDSTTFHGQIIGLGSRLLLRKTDNVGSDHNDLDIYPTYSIFKKVVRGVTPVDTTDLTTKAYVDGFLPLTGGTITGNLTATGTLTAGNTLVGGTLGLYTDKIRANGSSNIFTVSPFLYASSVTSAFNGTEANNTIMHKGYVVDNFVDLTSTQTIEGQKTFKPASGNSTLVVDAVTGSNSYASWRINGVAYTGLSSFTSSTVLKRDQGTTALTLFDTTARINVKLDVEGDLEVGDGTTNANPIITINSTTGGNPQLWFERNGTDTGKIVGNSTDMVLSRGSTSLSIGASSATFNTVVAGVTPVGATDLTTKAYVDDNANVVQQAAGYEMVMPTATPTVGQQLQVTSIAAGVATMVWV